MNAKDAAKLAALKNAAKVGMAAVDAGDVKTFTNAKALKRHLNDLAAKAMGKRKPD